MDTIKRVKRVDISPRHDKARNVEPKKYREILDPRVALQILIILDKYVGKSCSNCGHSFNEIRDVALGTPVLSDNGGIYCYSCAYPEWRDDQ